MTSASLADLAERAADRLALAVAVEHARVDVGRARDGGRVAEVVRDLACTARRIARLRAVFDVSAPGSVTASATAASTVAPHVRKSFALTSRPLAALRYSLMSAERTSHQRRASLVGEQLGRRRARRALSVATTAATSGSTTPCTRRLPDFAG